MTLLRAIFTCLLVLAAGIPAWAQLEEKSLGNSAELTLKENSLTSPLYTLFVGGKEFSKADQATLDTMAQVYVYRFTWVHYLTDQNKMADGLAKYENLIANTAIKLGHKSTVAYFAGQLVKNFRDVFNRPFEGNRLSTLNVAQLLPGLGKTRTEEASDYLVELIHDSKKPDAVKLFAVRALREFFPIKAYQETVVPDKVLEARKKREIDRVNALLEFYNHIQHSKSEDVVKLYFRREIVASLSYTHQPAVVAPKKAGKVEGPIAELLLQVLAPKTKISPAPLLGEKMEAAIGLAHMKMNDVTEYQSDLAMYLIGLTLVEVAESYRADLLNFQPKGSEKKPFYHWKIYSDRLRVALKAQADNHENLGINNQLIKAKKLLEQGSRLLEPLDKYTQPGINNDPQKIGEEFEKWLLPAHASIYKTIKSPPIGLK